MIVEIDGSAPPVLWRGARPTGFLPIDLARRASCIPATGDSGLHVACTPTLRDGRARPSTRAVFQALRARGLKVRAKPEHVPTRTSYEQLSLHRVEGCATGALRVPVPNSTTLGVILHAPPSESKKVSISDAELLGTTGGVN